MTPTAISTDAPARSDRSNASDRGLEAYRGLEASKREPLVSVVIPTLNEADNLAWVLERIPAWVSQVVVVDGLSTDHTEVVVRGLRANVTVIHQSRRGKGAALRAGFAGATGDIVVMLDADGSTHPREIGRFVRALQRGAEFVKGSRHMAGGGSDDFSLLRRLGNGAFVRLVNLVYGCRFTDLCYGYCAFWRRDLDRLGLTADGFEIETQLVLAAVRAGLRVREVPSFELPRRHGKSNLNALADGRRVLRTILRERPRRTARRPATSALPVLVPVRLAAPGSACWVPAGRDRRRADRRRRQDPTYTGPERRRGERRRQPSETVLVYRAVDPGPEIPLGGLGGVREPVPQIRPWPPAPAEA